VHSAQFFEYGRFNWRLLNKDEAGAVIDDFDGFLPEFWDRFDHNRLEVRQAGLSFYPDYSLVIIRESGDSAQATAAVYAPGDVRPLGDGLNALEAVNRIAPLRLAEDSAAEYASFLLWFALDGNWLPAETLTVAKDSGGFEIGGFAWNQGTWKQFRMVVGEKGDVLAFPTTVEQEASPRPPDSAEPPHVLESERFVRVRSALGVERWLKPEPDELLGVLRTLESSGELAGAIDIVRRAASLDFYEPYRLYELLQRDEGQFRRRYVLCDAKAGKIKILNGTSPPIHEVNHELGDERFGKVFEEEKQAEQYLRFFCWAIHGEEGPFYLVRRFREIAWAEAPRDPSKIALAVNDPERLSYCGFANGYYSFRALVCYSNALFQAELRVDWSGEVAMLDDEPLFEDLPIEKAAQAEGALIPLIPQVDLPEKRYRQDRSRRLPADDRLKWRAPEPAEAEDLIADFDALLPEFWAYFDHDNPEIRLAQLSFYADYQLAMVREKGGQRRTVLALYAPGDVRPLDGAAAAVEAVNRIDPLPLDEANVADYVWFRLTFCSRAPHVCMPDHSLASPSVSEDDGRQRYEIEGVALEGGFRQRFHATVAHDGTIRVQGEGEALSPLTVEQQANAARVPAMPFVRVRSVPAPAPWIEVQDEEERIRLEDALCEHGVVGQDELIVRRAGGLDCLQPFVLYEVLERGSDGGFRTAHLAFDAGRADLRSVDESAQAVEALANRARESQQGSWLARREDAEAYLDFWLWANSFFVIRRFHEIEWRQAPAPDQRSAVEDLLSRSSTPPPTEPDGTLRFARIVNSGNACFLGLFAVSPNGAVELQEERHRVAALPVNPPAAKRERFVNRQGPPTYLDDRCGDFHAERTPLTAWGLSELLRQDDSRIVLISDKRIGERFEMPSLKGRRVTFRNVWFEAELDLKRLQDAHSLEFYNCRFQGNVDASGVRITRDLVFYRCTFGGGSGLAEARFDEAEIGGDWILRRCLVTGGVFASRIQVQGDALLGGLRVHGSVRPFPERLFDNLQGRTAQVLEEYRARYQKRTGVTPLLRVALQLIGSRIDGRLELGALFAEPYRGLYSDGGHRPRLTSLAGQVAASSICVGGQCDWRGLIVLGSVDLIGARFGGWVNASSFYFGDNLVRLMVEGAMDFNSARLQSSIDLGAAYIGKGLSMPFVRIEGGLFARHQQKAGLSSVDQAVRLQVGAGDDRYSLNLSGAQCNSVEIDAPHFEGAVVAHTGQFGRLFIDFLAVIIAEGERGDKNPVLRLVSPAAEFVRLSSVKITESLGLATIQVVSKGTKAGYYARPEATGSLLIQQCEIGGNLTIGSDGSYLVGYQRLGHFGQIVFPRMFEVRHAAEDKKYRAKVPGEINLSQTTVKGNVNVTHVSVGERILLDAMKVGGDIRLSRYAANPWPRDAKNQPTFETCCSALEADLLQCDGDLDLTGLAVREPEEEERRQQRRHAWQGEADVTARGVKVGGEILFSPAEGEDRAKVGHGASIEGALRMPAASAARLILSGQNFGTAEGGAGGEAPRIDLERSTFRRLEVLYPLPSAIDLSNVTVDRWEIEGGDGGIDPHVALLERTEPFKTGTYAQVERALRQQGDTALADEVYRGMRRRWTREKKRRLQVDVERPDGGVLAIRWRLERARAWLSWLTDVLDGWAVGYGTNPYPLIAFVLLLMLPSLLIFRDQDNVVASMEVIDALPPGHFENVFEVHPRDAGHRWGWTEAAIMTARYHVPVIGNALNPRFEPTREPISLPSWLYVSWSPLSALPGHFVASAMTWANWLLWPWLLLVVVRNVRLRMAADPG
jgi:hypothetical protein